MNTQTRELLVRWQANAKRGQIANYDAANLFSGITLWLGVPAALASAAVGTTVFGSLDESLEVWAKILVGIASFATAVLTSLQTFLKSDDRAAKHRSAGAEYGTVKREIDEVLALECLPESQLVERVARIRERLDDLSREAPVVPRKVWKAATNVIPLARGGVGGAA